MNEIISGFGLLKIVWNLHLAILEVHIKLGLVHELIC
jgi:hypothetical protein